MNEKIAWVTDTTALLDDEFIQQYHIHVLPMVVIFEDVPYRELADLTFEEFYNKLRSAKKLPSTSQPVFGEMVALYQRLKEEGYTYAIAIHPSSKLSNTYNSSIAAGQQADFQVYTIDSQMISYPMMKMLEKGIKLEKEGASIEQIVTEIEQMANQSVLIGIPANLTQLHKSGRVPGLAALLGNLMQLKLIITFHEGSIVLEEKVRTIKRARQYATSLLRENIKQSVVSEVAIIHCNNEKDAIQWKKELQEDFPSIQFYIYPLSSAIAVHAGEGTTGLSWVRQRNL